MLSTPILRRAKERGQSVPNKSLRKRFEAQNLECAAIILADTDGFGGESALAVRWARIFMAAREPIATVRQHPQASFFAEAA